MKQQILRTASELFTTVGVKTTTMDDICEKIGISKKTLYNYYQNKTALVKDAISLHLEDFNEDMEQAFDKEMNPVQEIYNVKLHINNKLRERTPTAQFQLRKYYPKIFASVQKQQFEILQDFMTGNMERGMKEGYFRKDIKRDFILRLFFVTMMEMHNEIPLFAGKYNHDYMSFQYLEYHTRAIATPKGVEILEEILKNTSIPSIH